MDGFVSTLFGQRFTDKFGSGANAVIMCLLVASVIFATIPLQIPELTLSIVGAVVYSALQIGPVQRKNGQKKIAKQQKLDVQPVPEPRGRDWGQSGVSRGQGASWRAGAGQVARPTERVAKKNDFRQPSIAPILAPTFTSVGWDAEVQELLVDILPTPNGMKVVQMLVERAQHAIHAMIPEAEVTGFGCGNLKRGKAFGVAVPDVDIVVSVSPGALVKGLQHHLRSPHVAKLDARKLQKSAIRACTDQLVSASGFKFRRSSFKGYEPKVTLLGPVLPGVSDEAVPIDFSVNAATPLHNAALLTECGHMQPRVRELTLLVQRWARDRGISHAAKGNLPPYAWSLLTIYFAQVGVPEMGPLVPSLQGFQRSSALAGLKHISTATPLPKADLSLGELFKRFLKFYESEFQWRNEAVSVRSGQRGAPDLALPIHVTLTDDGSSIVAPSIEDPFEPSRNIGTFLTGVGCVRLREELKRAVEMCGSGCSLSVLLEPWAPPAWTNDNDNGDQEA